MKQILLLKIIELISLSKTIELNCKCIHSIFFFVHNVKNIKASRTGVSKYRTISNNGLVILLLSIPRSKITGDTGLYISLEFRFTR